MYGEHAPHPALAPYVECIWTRSGDDGPARHRVLPDGCVDILFQSDGGGPFAGAVVGTMTRAMVVEESLPAAYVAVRFRPGMAGGFLGGADLVELTDRSVPWAAVGGDLRVGDHDALADRLWRVKGTPEQVRLVEAYLLRRLAGVRDRRDPLVDPLVGAAIERLQWSAGASRIATLAADLGVSRQHLRRRFLAKVGITPKVFARVVRLRRAVDALLQSPRPRLVDLALDGGYSDQPHLVADFVELAGLAPTAFLAEQRTGR
jgi:AraC-like DNA-binding protein